MHLGVARRRAQHDPQRVAALDVAHRERRIVGADRAGSDQHRIAVGPELVGVGPCLLARDPLAGAVGRGRAAVEGGRQLQHHQRAPGAAVVEVGRELGRHLGREHAGSHLDAGLPQALQAAAVDPRVRIRRCRRRPG